MKWVFEWNSSPADSSKEPEDDEESDMPKDEEDELVLIDVWREEEDEVDAVDDRDLVKFDDCFNHKLSELIIWRLP